MNRLAVLGPRYSYSDLLARKAFPRATIVFHGGIEEIFREVNEGRCSEGLVPMENMLHGSVRETLNGLKRYKVKIICTFDFPIHHCLASQSDRYQIIISKAEALSQCSNFLKSLRKGISIEESSSTSKAVEMASKDSRYAAIGSEEAAHALGLQIIKKSIEDDKGNITRFILISKKENKEKKGKKGYRTSIMVVPERDSPGVLYDILGPFKEKGINLTKIESLPSGKRLGEYQFFIEIEGSETSKDVKYAINSIKGRHAVYSFGSYTSLLA